MRKHMEEEPSDELIGLEGHGLLFVTIGVVPPAEGDITIPDLEDTIIADSDPVGISAEIFEDTLGTIEGRLAIDNPFFMVELSSEHLESSVILEMMDAAGEYKLT
jgi:hypothetical protein